MSSEACSGDHTSLLGSKTEINVLLIDDDSSYIQLLSAGLTELDDQLNINTLSDPEDTIETIKSESIDCVLCDYKMDSLNGIQLLRIIREIHSDLPFILYTANGNEKIASEAISKGATEYAAKKVGADHYAYINTLIRHSVKEYYNSQIQSRRKELTELTETRGNAGGFELDLTNDIVLVTQGASDILNPPTTDFLSTPQFYSLFSSENKDVIQKNVQETLDTEDTITETIYTVDEHGAKQTLEITFFVTDYNSSNKLVRGVMKDVTEKLQKENQMEVFDRVLRHNIRNDLNLIRGHAEMIPQTDADDVREHVEKVIRESDQLLESVEKQRAIMDILRNDPTYDSIDLPQKLRSIQENIGETYPDANISVQTDATIDIYTSKRLPDAIEELVENAIQHNTVRTPVVAIKAKQTKQKLKIQIIDNSEEIPDMERGVLLEPDERTPLYHGSGLGLWLIKLIIRECGGKIEFETNDPHGNIIKLTIPR